MKSKLLSSIFKYKPLQVYQGLNGPTKIVSRKIRFGVEIELENTNVVYSTMAFKTVEDHSLKIEGIELVTIPIELQYIEVELQRIKGLLTLNELSFSKRCSVHAHMNVRDLNTEELYKFVLLYIIFEKALFRYSGNRYDNPYCIPLQEVNLFLELEKVAKGILTSIHWNKYLALNISPIWGTDGSFQKRYGTVEFRHMEGNMDVSRIMNWLNFMACLKLAAKKFDREDLEAHIRIMNTTSGYGWLAKTVFGYWTDMLVKYPGSESDITDGISYAKSHMQVEKSDNSTLKKKISTLEDKIFSPNEVLVVDF